jgi:hypothetical protein
VENQFKTVGELKELLKNLPDDQPIISQVCGSQEGACTMQGFFYASVPDFKESILQVSHPALPILPKLF